jgi:hypothetical protein
LDDGPVDLLHLAARKQRAQPAQRLRMPAEDEAAAGVAVEPMSERWGVRQTKTQLIEATFEIRAAAGSGMHGDARWLVDDQYEPVAIEHPSGQRL